MRKYLSLIVTLSAFYLSGFTQSQTRTATNLNNLANFQEAYGDQNFPRANAQDIAFNDNVFTCSGKMPSIKDSASSFHFNSVSSLVLQGFGFSIPENAIIGDITVMVRRYNNGRAPVGDYFMTLIQSYSGGGTGLPTTYGVHWTNRDDYPGKIYPETETDYSFTQSASGNNGGFLHTQAYDWTPAKINTVFFGLRIDSYPPVGKGPAQACYDQVEITVNFTLPPSIPSKSSVATEIISIKQPSVYPNPFTSKTNLQFTAVENGKVVVELYNITGAKVRTLFSGKVRKGQTYNVIAGDAQLPKGTYMYKINNGKQIQMGRMLKLE